MKMLYRFADWLAGRLNTFILAATFIMVASVSHAQIRTEHAVYAAAASVDVASTLYATSLGATERNPAIAWIGRRTNPVMMLSLGEVADFASVRLAESLLRKNHGKLLKFGLYSVSAIRFGIAARNVREGRRQTEWNRLYKY